MEGESSFSGLLNAARRILVAGMASFQTRVELFVVELQEEKSRLVEMLVWLVAAAFLSLMFLVVFTGFVIFLFPPEKRLYAAGGFCVIYLAGAVFALLNLKNLIRNGPQPFEESMNEFKKDREWLDSSK